jgi:hypothetical protein
MDEYIDDSTVEIITSSKKSWSRFSLIIFISLIIMCIIGTWKIFVKARKPGI